MESLAPNGLLSVWRDGHWLDSRDSRTISSSFSLRSLFPPINDVCLRCCLGLSRLYLLHEISQQPLISRISCVKKIVYSPVQSLFFFYDPSRVRSDWCLSCLARKKWLFVLGDYLQNNDSQRRKCHKNKKRHTSFLTSFTQLIGKFDLSFLISQGFKFGRKIQVNRIVVRAGLPLFHYSF